MSLKSRIDSDIKSAMLNKEKEVLTALRGIKSMILLAETEKGASDQLSDDVEMKLLMKAAKQRKESAELYSQEGREDLAEKEIFEYNVIARYLPQQMSREELEVALVDLIKEIGATGPSEMGKVMGLATKKFAGKADGKQIAEIVKSKLLGN